MYSFKNENIIINLREFLLLLLICMCVYVYAPPISNVSHSCISSESTHLMSATSDAGCQKFPTKTGDETGGENILKYSILRLVNKIRDYLIKFLTVVGLFSHLIFC